MKITVNGQRYDLSTMINLGISTRENHGVSVEAVYFGPKSHRLIVQSYSIWASSRNDGTVVGRCYCVYEPEDPCWVDQMQSAIDEIVAVSGSDAGVLMAAMDEHTPALKG